MSDNNKKSVASLLENEKESLWQKWIVGNAPLIVAIFANFVVVVSDVRVYDVISRLTLSWWKALGASLACAIPFLMWEISWQYNHTTDSWRIVSLLMAGLAFATSIVLGIADYIMPDPSVANWLLGGVVVLTGVHTIVGFLYYYNDPDVARTRRKAQALGKMQDQELNAEVAKSLLQSGRGVLNVISELEKQFDPEDVARILALLTGSKLSEPAKRGFKQPQNSFASDTHRVQDERKQENRPEDRANPTQRPPQS